MMRCGERGVLGAVRRRKIIRETGGHCTRQLNRDTRFDGGAIGLIRSDCGGRGGSGGGGGEY